MTKKEFNNKFGRLKVKIQPKFYVVKLILGGSEFEQECIGKSYIHFKGYSRKHKVSVNIYVDVSKIDYTIFEQGIIAGLLNYDIAVAIDNEIGVEKYRCSIYNDC